MDHLLDNLENLPKRESRKDYLTRKYGDMWDLKKFDHPHYRSENSDYPWVKAERVIKKFIGKQFDKAFSYYCKQVEQFEQYHFHTYFKKDEHRWNRSYPSKFIVDKNGNIQRNKEYEQKPWKKKNKDKKVIFTSFDYKEGYYNKETGETVTQLSYCATFKHNRHKWKEIVVSGFWKEFESKEDKEYIRLMIEDKKRKKLEERRYKKWLKEKQYSFLTKKEEELLKQKETDLIKRDSHGFDENSFKGIEYHGQKRKRKPDEL